METTLDEAVEAQNSKDIDWAKIKSTARVAKQDVGMLLIFYGTARGGSQKGSDVAEKCF